MKASEFEKLSKSQQRDELKRVNTTYAKRVQTSGSKIQNLERYKEALADIQGLEADPTPALSNAGGTVESFTAAIIPTDEPIFDCIAVCLGLLNFPLPGYHIIADDSLDEELLTSLHDLIVQLSRSTPEKPPQWCTATAQSNLVVEVQEAFQGKTVRIPEELSPVFDAFSIMYQVIDPAEIDEAQQSLLQTNTLLVQNVISQRIGQWLRRAPDPPAGSAIWPEHFTPAERCMIRRLIREKLDEDTEGWRADKEPSSDLLTSIVDDMTVAKGRNQNVVARVIVQLKAEMKSRASKKRKADALEEENDDEDAAGN